uniref:Baculoviral IAP repeat-containing protein n=1 Tax=Sicyonia whispovirus TaxID=2984283 RepID=A0A9C7F7C3_9VIRU|nr:MAG: baculoviral IAP repeat-containing protein [Sicyonia whispovirus]
MGNALYANTSIQQEQYRVATFGDQKYAIDKSALARAGFYHTKIGDGIKCYECNLEINAKTLKGSDNIAIIHKEKSPECLFEKGMITPLLKPERSKTFISFSSLRFEKERLDTYIDWPIEWLTPEDLAADGFYYLRTADHCACVFCRGIIGSWEIGDTPRGEHQRHFPHCPFLRGQPVGNVSISHSSILTKLQSQENPPDSEAINQKGNMHICRTPRHMAGSYPETPQYSEPKHKGFLTVERRLGSYSAWPDRVSQKPNDLADAGFFYCGLSDHVRCFHCGNGLRNWENDDIPWNEHARWYPECSYVLLRKGKDFIDKYRQENTPCICTAPATRTSTSKTLCLSPAFSNRHTITDKDLGRLMDLDIIRGVIGMGFPTQIVKAALRDHVQKTCMPYFNMESCIEAVLNKIEEEARQNVHSTNCPREKRQ